MFILHLHTEVVQTFSYWLKNVLFALFFVFFLLRSPAMLPIASEKSLNGTKTAIFCFDQKSLITLRR